MVRGSLAACLCLYAVVALAGASAFGPRVDSNVIVSLSSRRGLLPAEAVAGLHAAVALMSLCAFPLNAFALRAALHGMVHGNAVEASARDRWRMGGLVTLASYAVALQGAFEAATCTFVGVCSYGGVEQGVASVPQ